MKAMFALWGVTAPVLLDPGLRERLRAAGARRLVVEVHDEHVTQAQLRLTTYDEPVAAVVSVWTDGDPARVTEVLDGIADRVDGWLVEERTPLPPRPAADGVRVDALVNVALLRVPAAMPRPEWLDRWLQHHTPVAIETQATFGYVQNVVVEPLVQGRPPVDALVEEFFPMRALTDVHAFYGSDGDGAELDRRMTRMLESVGTFGAHENIDVVPTSRYEFTLAVT